jgi:transcriptional regulator GlxA family with amidase domain
MSRIRRTLTKTGARSRTIGFVGFNGISALDLVGPYEAFTNAAGKDRRYTCRILGLSDQPFTSEAGMTFRPHAQLGSARDLDTLIIPGGAGLRDPAINGPLVRWLSANATRIRRVASVCTGIYALAPTGLLDGRRVTTHWRFAADVAERFPALRVEADQIFIRDGRFFTSAGVTAAIDLALSLIEADHGAHLAVEVARELVVYLKRSGGQDQYSNPLRLQASSGNGLAELTAWMSENLSQPLTIDTLAERARLSPRQLQRRFVSAFGRPVGEIVESLRLNVARERLSDHAGTVESVARLVGFRSADVFRRAFVRRYGTRPSDYRERFATGANGLEN